MVGSWWQDTPALGGAVSRRPTDTPGTRCDSDRGLRQGSQHQEGPSPKTRPTIESPLRKLDTTDISARARGEARNREVHLPPVSTYRWWARRTEAVNGAIIEAVNVDQPGQLVVSDPFAGGGVIPLAAVMRGHCVYAQDLNPWAASGLAAMLALPNTDALRSGIAALTQRVLPEAEAAYGTVLSDGTPGQVSGYVRTAAIVRGFFHMGLSASCFEQSGTGPRRFSPARTVIFFRPVETNARPARPAQPERTPRRATRPEEWSPAPAAIRKVSRPALQAVWNGKWCLSSEQAGVDAS